MKQTYTFTYEFSCRSTEDAQQLAIELNCTASIQPSKITDDQGRTVPLPNFE